MPIAETKKAQGEPAFVTSMANWIRQPEFQADVSRIALEALSGLVPR